MDPSRVVHDSPHNTSRHITHPRTPPQLARCTVRAVTAGCTYEPSNRVSMCTKCVSRYTRPFYQGVSIKYQDDTRLDRDIAVAKFRKFFAVKYIVIIKDSFDEKDNCSLSLFKVYINGFKIHFQSVEKSISIYIMIRFDSLREAIIIIDIPYLAA